MKTFNEYIDQNAGPIATDQLDIIRVDEYYQIFNHTEPLLTPMGQPCAVQSERLAQLLLTDLMGRNKTDKPGITPATLFGFQKDIFEIAGDPYPGSREKLLSTDPFLTIKSTGKFRFQSFSPEDELFSFAFISLSSLIRSVNSYVSAIMHEIILPDSETTPFPEILKYSYSRLDTGKKVVLQAWSSVHGSGVVLPLLLVTGAISPLEYVNGLIALKMQEVHRRDQILLDAVSGLGYLACLEQDDGAADLLAMLRRKGENDTVEFKSTLRWDIRAGKTNPAIERASLKTIAAFLNSAGGTLLIGIRDDGSVEGIETDKFANEDKFLLHLWTLIRTCLGREVSPFIRTTLEKAEDRTVCQVQCRQSSRPVFLKQPGFDEEFYIRLGPSTNAMDISEALKYIADRFKTSD